MLLLCLAIGVLLAHPLQAPADPAAKTQRDAPAPESEAALRERVARWWDARMASERRTMYDLYSSEYRGATSYEDFIGESAVRHRTPIFSHEILEVRIEGDRAWVMLGYRIMPRPGPVIDSRLEDEWVREAGGWFKVHKPPMSPFPPFGPMPMPKNPASEPVPPKPN